MSELVKSDDLAVVESALRLLSTLIFSCETNSRFGSSDRRQLKSLSSYLIPMVSLWGGKATGFSLVTLLSEDSNLEVSEASLMNYDHRF